MKTLSLMICILITINTYSQTFVAIETTTKGFGMAVGIQSEEGLQILGGYNVSIINSRNPKLFYGKAGYNILLSHNDEDNFSITPTIGAAQSSVKVFDNKDTPTTIKGIKPIYGLELDKDWYMGRLFVSANYCSTAYYGIGIKAFFK